MHRPSKDEAEHEAAKKPGDGCVYIDGKDMSNNDIVAQKKNEGKCCINMQTRWKSFLVGQVCVMSVIFTFAVLKDKIKVADGATGKMVVIGGRYNEQNLSSSVYIYSVANGEVECMKKGADAPYGWFLAGAALSGTDVYIVGGSSSPLIRGHRVARYDTIHDTWEELPSLMHDRHLKPAVFILNGALYAAGGSDETTAVEYLDIQADVSSWKETGVSLPEKIIYATNVLIRDRVYLSGIQHSKNKGWSFSSSLTWSVDFPFWSTLHTSGPTESQCMVTDGENYIWSINKSQIFQYSLSEIYREPTAIIGDHMTLNGNICVYWNGYIYIRDTYRKGIFHAYNVKEKVWKTSYAQGSIDDLEVPMVAIIAET